MYVVVAVGIGRRVAERDRDVVYRCLGDLYGVVRCGLAFNHGARSGEADDCGVGIRVRWRGFVGNNRADLAHANHGVLEAASGGVSDADGVALATFG